MVPIPSLTKLLSEIEDPNVFFSSCLPSLEFNQHPSITNPPPDFATKESIASFFPRFVDYAIRKIIRNTVSSSKIVLESRLAADLSLEFLKNNIDEQKISTLPQQYRITLEKGQKWITRYKSQLTNWDEVLDETYYLAQMDSLYQTRKLNRYHSLSPNEKTRLKDFLRPIYTFFTASFPVEKYAILKPSLAHYLICKTQADLLIDGSILLIETTQNPEEIINKRFYHLLGFVSLFNYLQRERQRDFSDLYRYLKTAEKLSEQQIKNIHQTITNQFSYLSNVSNLTKLGYFLPCSEKVVRASISSWKNKDVLEFLKKLFNKRMEITPEKYRKEISSLHPT